MDIYSFGMLCLWLLFRGTFSETVSIPSDIFGHGRGPILFTLPRGEQSGQNLPPELKSEDRFPALARHLIMETASFDNEQKYGLCKFFKLCLARDPNERSSNLGVLLKLLNPDYTIKHTMHSSDDETVSSYEGFQVI
jgi:hypothetical protein